MMKKFFRIGHLCTTNSFGGLEMNVIHLARWMNERGHANLVFCRKASPLFENARSSDLHFRTIDPSMRYFDFFSAKKLGNMIVEERLDAIFIHTSMDINLGVIAKRFFSRRTALVYVQHMQIGMKKKDMLHTWQYRHLDAWLAPLLLMKRNVLENTNIDARRIHVVPLGIDLSKFQPHAQSKDAVRQQYGIPFDAYVCGVIGRLDYGKGQEYFIRAIAALKEKGIIVHGLIVGDATKESTNAYRDELERIVREEKIGGLIHFHPFEKNIARAMTVLDVFCLTSISETYGMVTIEAMAMQLPIIATNSAGTPEIIQQERNGLLVAPQQVQALAQAILRLHDDRAFAAQLAMQARGDAEKYFSHEKQCASVEDILLGIK